MSIEQNWCKVTIFQSESMSNVIRCINKRFVFKNSVILCLALIFNLSNPRTTILHAVPSCEIQWVMYSFSWRELWTNGSVLKARCCECGVMSSIPAECWNSLQLLGHFAWHWTSQCTNTRSFIVLHSLFLDFVSGYPRFLPLYVNIRLPLFWST